MSSPVSVAILLFSCLAVGMEHKQEVLISIPCVSIYNCSGYVATGKIIGKDAQAKQHNSHFLCYQAIIKVISNPSYKSNINKMADLMALERHDPFDNAIWLLEYVSKTKGAEHLKPASRNLNYLQYLCLDVVAFLLMVCYVGAWLAYKAHCRLWYSRGSKLKVE